jgi:hypothetical protein
MHNIHSSKIGEHRLSLGHPFFLNLLLFPKQQNFDGVMWTHRHKLDTFSFYSVTVRGLKLEAKNQGDQDWAEVCRFYYSVCSSLWRATTFCLRPTAKLSAEGLESTFFLSWHLTPLRLAKREPLFFRL